MQGTVQFSSIVELTRLINSKLNLCEALTKVIQAITQDIVQCDSVNFYLTQADGNLHGYVGNVVSHSLLNKISLDIKSDLYVRDIVSLRQSIYIPDISGDQRPNPDLVNLFKIKSILGVPIFYQDELLGIVFLANYKAPLNLTAADIQTIETYVNIAAVTIRNAYLFTNKEELLYEKQILLEATRKLSFCLTSQEVLEVCFQFVGKVLNTTELNVQIKEVAESILITEQWDSQTLDEENSGLTEATDQHRIVLPLVAMGETLGTITAHTSLLPTGSKPNLQLAKSIVDATATALSNVIRREKLEEIVELRTSELREKNAILEMVVAEIQRLSRQNELILNSAGEGIYGLDIRGNITFCNPTAALMFGYDIDEMVGNPHDHILHHLRPDHLRYKFEQSPIYTALHNGTVQHVTDEFFCRKDGSIFPVEYVSTPIKESEEIVGVVITLKDITERKALEGKIRHQAHYDSLTLLPNRVLINQKLGDALHHAKLENSAVGVMFLDLDRFKLINDTLGHSIGDQMLKQVAERLNSCLEPHVAIGRLGGDEFIVLVEKVSGKADLTRIAEKFLRCLDKPFHIDGHELFTSASIGISIYPKDSEDIEVLISNADAAMYLSKEQGGNCLNYYSPILNKQSTERASLLNNLHHALDRDEFEVYYQPIVDIRDAKIVGTEALIRWHHPQWGLVSPARFIPLAEESGLIIPIGEWVLRQACKQNKSWQNAGFPDLCISVNFAARQFNQPDVFAMITRILGETELDPQYLELELMENIIIQSSAIQKLQQLKKLGIQISIDDFGTGYSSLRYLKDFPLDILKIDQSFIRYSSSDASIRAITSTIINLAQNLDLSVIAEGVETADEIVYLQSQFCNMMQGYYFSKPLPAGELTQLLLSSKDFGIYDELKYRGFV